MKKILALVLVLAVAQLASAAISWEVAQLTDTTFSVSLVATENVQDVSIAQLVTNGATFAVTPLDSSVWLGNFGGTKQGFFDLAGFGAAGYGAAMGTNTAAGVYATGTLLSFTAVGAVGDVILVQNLPAFSMNSYVITQAGGTQTFEALNAGSFELVPEPMTMALLGLGGLFIRRRRA